MENRTRRGKITVKLRKSHAKEHHNLYSSPYVIRVIFKVDEIGGTCSSGGSNCVATSFSRETLLHGVT